MYNNIDQMYVSIVAKQISLCCDYFATIAIVIKASYRGGCCRPISGSQD
jgi:hypothetical protein